MKSLLKIFKPSSILPLIGAAALLVLSGKLDAKESPSRDKIASIRSEKGGSSTGFFAKQGDKIYLFTSIFSLAKGGLIVYSSDGKQVQTGQYEIAADRDLVRTPVQNISNFFEIEEENVMGETVTICSEVSRDGDGNIVTDAQDFTGKVLGVGPESFRVSTPGSSSDIVGSPVVCENGKVIGAMSYEIPSFGKSDVAKKNPKSISMYAVKWENNTCARINGNIKWIAVNKAQEIVAQGKLLTDARNFVDKYLTVMHLWYANPYETIDPAGAAPELKVWIADHNKKIANSPKYIANIESDINHYQEQARILQEIAKNDGYRFASYITAKSTPLRNPEGSPFVKLYYGESTKVFDAICQIVIIRSTNLLYIYPNDVVKTEGN